MLVSVSNTSTADNGIDASSLTISPNTYLAILSALGDDVGGTELAGKPLPGLVT